MSCIGWQLRRWAAMLADNGGRDDEAVPVVVHRLRRSGSGIYINEDLACGHKHITIVDETTWPPITVTCLVRFGFRHPTSHFKVEEKDD